MTAEHLPQPQMAGPYGAADLRGREAMSQPVTTDEMLAAALWYAAQGRWVFPVEAGGKRPAPKALHGFKSSTSRADEIRAWWHKPFNIGCPTGVTGEDVVDVDVRPEGNGWEAFNRLKAAGLLAGAHRLVRTRSGGLHVSFAGTSQQCGSLKGQFIDFKASGGYVLLPPSYVGGRRYELIEERAPTGATFDWQAAKQLLAPPRPYRATRSYRTGAGTQKHLARWLEGEFEGNRNSGLFWACLRALEAGDEDAVDDLAAVARAAGLTEPEVRKTVESAYREVNG